MLTVLSAFWQIALFRSGPEHLPDSTFFLSLALGFFVAVEVLAIVSLYPLRMLIPLLLTDTLLLVIWSGSLLVLTGFGQRLRATLAALFGTAALLQLVAYPFSAVLPASYDPLRVSALVLILLWTIAVYGYIISSAMARSFGIGVAAAVVYFVISFQVLAQLTADL